MAPGGVATDFGSRSMVRTYEGDDAGVYTDTASKTVQTFSLRPHGYTSSETLGEVIFGAATDGSSQTRYVVGKDATALLAERAAVGDEAFITGLQQRFGLTPAAN